MHHAVSELLLLGNRLGNSHQLLNNSNINSRDGVFVTLFLHKLRNPKYMVVCNNKMEEVH
jgi:hypothetical protein